MGFAFSDVRVWLPCLDTFSVCLCGYPKMLKTTDGQIVTPWDVKGDGGIDYGKLQLSFASVACSRINEVLRAAVVGDGACFV